MPSMDVKKTSMDDLGRISPDEYKKSTKAPVCLVLDNIRSLQNVGSLFRTGDAFRISKVFLCGITGQPPNREIEKTALGATESVDHQYFSETSDAINHLKQEGWEIVAIEQTDSSLMLNSFNPEKGSKYAFVFGNEVFGVSDQFIQNADLILEIPQFGTKHSFNVSVSAGIILWDFYSKNNLNVF